MFEPVNRAFGANGVLISVAVCALLMMAYVMFNRVPFSDPGMRAVAAANA
jgi:hypothetical protein